jgi:hypothetical protein
LVRSRFFTGKLTNIFRDMFGTSSTRYVLEKMEGHALR